MSEIKNDGLDQYGAEPFEQQQFGIAGVEGLMSHTQCDVSCSISRGNDIGPLESRKYVRQVNSELNIQY